MAYNECNHIVTLEYLQGFISGLVQNGSGTIISVNMRGKDPSYCPTYGDLIGGTYIQVRSIGVQPSSDVDGISIGGSYSSNQCVMQQDLSVGYTRFKNITSTASTKTISECGGNSTLSYTLTFTRTTKSMNQSCSTASTSTDVNDTSAVWTTSSFGGISGSEFSVGKNGSVSANSRTTTITVSKPFREATRSSSFNITQNALTGSYSVFVSSGITSYDTFSITGIKSFGCNGGTTTSAGTYTITSTYKWKDSCGVEYPNVTSAMTTSKTESGTITVGARSPYDSTCTPATGTTITVNWHGKTDTYTQTCSCISCNCDKLNISVS